MTAMSNSRQIREDRTRMRAQRIRRDAGRPKAAADEHWRMAEAQEAADAEADVASEDRLYAKRPLVPHRHGHCELNRNRARPDFYTSSSDEHLGDTAMMNGRAPDDARA